MKKNIYKTALTFGLGLGILFFVSCGGNSGNSLPKNEYVGNVPSIVAEYNDDKAKLQAEEDKEAKNVNSMSKDELLKKMKEFAEKEKTIEEKMETALEAEKTALKGKELPVVNENPAVEVAGMKVHDINDKYVVFKGSISVKEELANTSIKCIMQDKDGNTIEEIEASINAPYEYGKNGASVGSYEITARIKIDKPESAKLAKMVFVSNQQ